MCGYDIEASSSCVGIKAKSFMKISVVLTRDIFMNISVVLTRVSVIDTVQRSRNRCIEVADER